MLPHFAIDRQLRRWRKNAGKSRASNSGYGVGDIHGQAFVLTLKRHNRVEVAAVSQTARALSIAPGMTLTQAKALYASVMHEDYQAAEDEKAFNALGRWLIRFSPHVCRELPADDDDEPSPDKPRALYLNLFGMQRLASSSEMMQRITHALDRLGIQARPAVAPNPAAAYALAVAGKQPLLEDADPDMLREALSPLPIEALRLPAGMRNTLHHLGLHTIGALLQLPRDSLVARFDDLLMHHLDQALGRDTLPLTPLRPEPRIEASIEFDGVLQQIEVVWEVFAELLRQIISQLLVVGCGARRLVIEMRRSQVEPITRRVDLSAPTRDLRTLMGLCRCALEDVLQEQSKTVYVRTRASPAPTETSPKAQPPPTKRRQQFVRDPSEGFIGMAMKCEVFEPMFAVQRSLLGELEAGHEQALTALVDRLTLRLGQESIAQVRLVDAHVPEKAFRYVEPFSAEVEAAVAPSSRQSSKTRKKQSMSQEQTINAEALGWARPLALQHPRPIRVLLWPNHDADGQPVAFGEIDDAQHGQPPPPMTQVVECVGPERIAGRWWEQHCRTRDYFDVADETGRHWWIFRVQETQQWFVHGEFS